MMDDPKQKPAEAGPSDAAPVESAALARRDFLASLGKWSAAVIGGVTMAGIFGNPGGAEARGWANGRGGGGGWVNGRGGGGGWVNGRGGGGGWANGRGGGGGWANGRGGGGGGWANRRGLGGAWANNR